MLNVYAVSYTFIINHFSLLKRLGSGGFEVDSDVIYHIMHVFLRYTIQLLAIGQSSVSI